MKRKLVAAALVLFLFCQRADAAKEIPDKDGILQWGLAQTATSMDDPMRLVISIKDPNDGSKLIEKDIEVPDIPQYVRPIPLATDTPATYGARVVKAQEDHSKLKAEKIKAAVDGVLGVGTATVAQTTKLADTGSPIWNYNFGGGNITKIKNGQLTISGAQKITYGATDALKKQRAKEIKDAKAFNADPKNKNNKIPVPKPIGNNHTGEVGDSTQFVPKQPPSPGSSPGSRGSMSSMNYDLATEFPGEFPGLPMVASGMDEEGNSSYVQFGILDTYVATLPLVAGESDEGMYLGLKALLDANGLPASYDSSTHSLFLNYEFADSHELYWANTDTGFAEYLQVSYGSPVPEPATMLLLAIGMAGVAWVRKRTGRLHERGSTYFR